MSDAPPRVANPGNSAGSRRGLAAKFRYFLAAFSLANLCLIAAWFASLFDSDYGYFNKVPVGSNTLLALLVNLALLSLLFWSASLWLVRRPVTRFIAEIALLAIMVFPLDFFRSVIFRIPDRVLVKALHSLPMVLVIVICLVVVLRWRAHLARLIILFLLLISPLAFFTVGRTLLVLVGWQKIRQAPRLQQAAAPLLQSSLSSRVIWILFDELDYRFAFVDRPKTLRIPELDTFLADSFHATHAYPPAGATILTLPALISGVRVIAATPRSASDLSLEVDWMDSTNPSRSSKVSWQELPSVFSRARSLGANSAIVGWYHPYDRLFTNSVSYCEWFPLPAVEPARAPTFLGTMQRELCAMAGPFNNRYLHLRNYERSLQISASLAATNAYQLVFLHLPIPHKPGIADVNGHLTFAGVAGPGAYFGNVQLASRAFGAIRRAMEDSGTWTKSWVIVSSDHWWREGTGNTGTIDHRIPFIVKAPDVRAEEYQRPFNTLETHGLVLAVLKGQLKGAGEIRGWLDQHHVPPPEEIAQETEHDRNPE